MLTICLALILADADQARAVLALAAAQATQSNPRLAMPVESTIPTPVSKPRPATPKEARPAKPQGSPVKPLMRDAAKQYQNRTPAVVQGESSRLEQPLRWVSKPGWHQLDLMHGNVQVGAYNTRTRVYRPYDAATDTWGEPEDYLPLALPRLQSAAPVPFRSGGNC